MTKAGAEERLRRILSVVPWVAAHDGPTLTEVCTRFGYDSEDELREELDLLFLCGVPPYTPDSLIEVDMAKGRVWIRYADWFSRPLRLTPAEALTLVAASSALLDATDSDRMAGDGDGPLARGLAKLAQALGVEEDAVDVTLAPPPGLTSLQKAAADHRQVEIDYYSYGRDEHTVRVIDPHLVYSAAGQWYVAAYCHRVEADRLFRIDRIRDLRVLDTTFAPKPMDAPPTFDPSPDDPVIVLDLERAAAWAATQYPANRIEDLGGGRWRVELRVTGQAWLARLLLRLGPDARVVEGDASAAVEAAARILARYR